MSIATRENEHSGWLQRFTFRFTAVYLFLFNLPVLGIEFDPPIWLQGIYSKLWQAIVPWVGYNVLGMEKAYSNRSFVWDDSDSMFAWIRWGCYLGIALLAALTWVWFDVRRRHDRMIHELVRIYVRYALVAAMFSYGFVKVFLQQFPHNELDWFYYKWGDLTPFMLMWGFMGHSNAYQAFAGIIEVLGGALLLSRCTTTLGALVVAAVMSNVVMLDLCFDVPVKLNSINFLGFAIFLTFPEWNRLANFFVFNRSSEPVPLAPLWRASWIRRTAVITKLLTVGLILYANVLPFAQQASRKRHMSQSEFYGLYEVETFKRASQVVPPLLTDTNRWREAKFAKDGDFAVLGMDEGLLFSYRSSQILHEKKDATHGTLTIQLRPKPSASGEEATTPPIVAAYSRPAPDQLLLEGKFDGEELSVLLRRTDENDLPLLKHKFRWVGR